jgi:hypothetical protein
MENHSAIRGLKISHRGACALLVDYATRCSGARSRSRGRSVDVEDALLSQGTTSGGRWLRVPRSRKSPMRLLGRSLAIWGWCAGCGCGELRNRPLGLFQRSRGLRGRRPPRRLTGAGNLQQARFPNARKAQQTHVPKVRKMQQQRVLNVQNSSPACPSTLPPGRPPGRTPPPAGFSRP